MLLVYTTMPSMQEAKDIATHVVQKNLAAGANIIPGAYSIYHWQGKVEHAEECICLFQSTQELFAPLTNAIKERHSYEVPCIIAMPLEEAEKHFAAWITQHCKPNFPF